MKKFNLFLMGLAAIGAVGCSSDEPKGGAENGEDTPRVEIELSRGQQEVVNAQNGFALRLFNQLLSTGAPTKNHIVSPLSLSLALSMTANFFNDTATTEIYTTLGYEGATSEEVNSLARVMMDRLPAADGKTRLAIANSLWIQNDFPVLDTFKQDGMNWYDAEVSNVELSSDAAKNTINSWIKKKTNGMIPVVLGKDMELDMFDLAVMINAMYFKSQWMFRFPKKDTKEKLFNNVSGSKPLVKMMTSGSDARLLGLVDDEGTSIASLPYGNGTFHMTLVMPAEGKDLQSFVAGLTQEDLEQYETELSSTDTGIKTCQVTIPRFTHESSYDLMETLQSLGIQLAMTPAADFTRLSPVTGIGIQKAVQCNKIIVDEEGTEAASTTVVVVGSYTSGFSPASRIVFDRPFIYMITEESTGAILFMGTVAEM